MLLITHLAQLTAEAPPARSMRLRCKPEWADLPDGPRRGAMLSPFRGRVIGCLERFTRMLSIRTSTCRKCGQKNELAIAMWANELDVNCSRCGAKLTLPRIDREEAGAR